MASYDRERIEEAIEAMLMIARSKGVYQTKDMYDKLERLVSSVRDEAVAYTWTEACSQYDRGMDPRNFTIPLLVQKARDDLNPER